MRPQKFLLALAIAGAGTLTAHANSYTASIDACESELSNRLGLAEVNTNYNIKKVKSRSRYRDINFSVSAFDKTHPVQKVRAKCKVKPNGTVLAVDFDADTLPASIATN